MVLDGNLSQEYPVNAGVTQGSILGPSLFLLHNNDLSDDVICNSAIYAAYTTLSSNCDQASDLLQQLELPSHLGDTTDWARSGFLILVLEKLNCSFGWSNNFSVIDVKMDGFVLEEKSSFKMLGSTFSSELGWGSYIISNAKTVYKKIGALIHSMKFLSP